MLQITLLGDLTLTWDDQSLPAIASTRARALFAYLVLNRERSHNRTVLAGLFWPNLPESKARQRLRQALWHIARRIDDLPPGPYLLREGDLVGFNSALPHQVDVELFERLSRGDIDDMADAVRIYRGDLLADVYEDWALEEREPLRERWLVLLDNLARLYRQEGQHDASVEITRRLLQSDPWHEPAARRLMRLLDAKGRTGEALQIYHNLRGALQTDLGIAPASQTTELYRQLKASHPQTPPPASSEPPLEPLIRSREMAVLEEALGSARKNRGQLVLLTGSSGIGKTYLAHRLSERAYRLGFLPLYAHAVEPFGPPAPYHPLDDALRSALATLNLTFESTPLVQTALAALLPESVQTATSVATTSLVPDHFHAALAGALTEIAGYGPLLLILDDLHWADVAVWAVLYELISRLAGSSLVVIAIFRTADLPKNIVPWLDHLTSHPAASLLALEPLSTQEIRQLSTRLIHTVLPSDLIDRLHRETGGNPLFVTEVILGLVETGGFYPDKQGQLTLSSDAALPIPPTLREALAARLSHLSSQSYRLLCQAAILGDRYDFDLLLSLSGEQDEEYFLEQLEVLLERNLLVEEGDVYRFAHNLVRRVLYDEIHPRRRRLWHRRAAQVLADVAPQQIAARARHAYAAQCWQEAVSLSLEAADQALALFAVEEAKAFYTLAQDAAQNLADVSPALRLRWLGGLARACYMHGDKDAEAQAIEKWHALAHELNNAEEEALALAWWAGNLCFRGLSADAVPLAQRAVNLAQGAEQTLSIVQHCLGLCYDRLGDKAMAMVFYNQAAEVACEAGLSQHEARCLNSLATLLQEKGDIEQAAEAYRRSAELAAACRDRLAEGRALNNLGTLCVLRGEYGPARCAYENVLAAVKALGLREGICIVEGNLGEVWSLMGYMDKASAYYQSGLTLATRLDNPGLHAKFLMWLAELAIVTDDLPKAERYLQEAHQVLPQQGIQQEHLYHDYLAAKLSLAQNTVADAAEQVPRLAQQSQTTGMVWMRGLIAALVGRIKAAQGDWAPAELSLRRAVQMCEEQGLRDSAIVAYTELGLVLRRTGQEIESDQILARAWEEIARRMMRLDLARLLEKLGRPPTLPGQVDVTLPRHDAPLRRHPTPDECATILWTPDAGSLEPQLRRVPLRRARLRRLLTEADVQGCAPTIKHLAQALNVSPATLNNDLAALRREGWPVATRGAPLTV